MLAENDLSLLDTQGISFKSEQDMPRGCLVQALCDQILSKMRKDMKTKIMKNFNTKLVVDTAEKLQEYTSEHGDIELLAKATGVSQR